jgi:hypothetical protein
MRCEVEQLGGARPVTLIHEHYYAGTARAAGPRRPGHGGRVAAAVPRLADRGWPTMARGLGLADRG